MDHSESCSQCASFSMHFDSVYNFFKCLNCGFLWAYDFHDPDYDDCDLDEINYILD
jgi:hypothetical protein